MDLEPILSRLDRIEQNQQRILEKLKGDPTVQHSSGSIPESFLPGGKDWFLMASKEEIIAFNRERGARDRRGKRTRKQQPRED
jgi:hypothetical protein